MLNLTDYIPSQLSLWWNRKIPKETPPDALPDELLVLIFSLLPPQTVAKCLLVNWQWNRCAQDAHLWKVLAAQNNVPVPETSLHPMRQYFRYHPKRVKALKQQRIEISDPDLKQGLSSGMKYVWHGADLGCVYPGQKRTKLWDLATKRCLMEVPEAATCMNFDSVALITAVQTDECLILKHYPRNSNDSNGVGGLLQSVNVKNCSMLDLNESTIFAVSSKKIFQIDRATAQMVQIKRKNVTVLMNEDEMLFSGSQKGRFSMRDLRASKPVFTKTLKPRKPIKKLSKDNDLLVVAHPDYFKIWDVRQLKEPLHEIKVEGRYAALDSHKGIFAYAQGDQALPIMSTAYLSYCTVKLIESESYQGIKILHNQVDPFPMDICWSKSTDSLYVLLEGGTIRGWQF